MYDEKQAEFSENQDLEAEVNEILHLLEEKKYSKLRSILLETNVVDIAEILENISDRLGLDKEILVFRMLPKDLSVEVFAYLPEDDQVDIVNGITQHEIDHIMEELAFDDMIDLLEELPANLVDKILINTPPEERRLINTFLNYPENSAGSLMTIDYIDFKENMTVQQCLKHIKEAGLDSETVYSCYVMDSQRTLKGVVSLKSLVMADSDTKVNEIMRMEMISVNVLTDQEEVSNKFKRYGLLALPVVDKEGRLVGIITVDDIFDVIDDEATEDIQLMAGVTGADDEYLDMSVFKHVKSRLFWLFILTCSYMITGGIIETFEAMLSDVACLIVYMPLLMGTGGNSGSQSATLIIRGMAMGEISLKDFLKVVWKELRVSFVAGLALSLLNFLRVMYIDGNGFFVALTISAAMLVTVMVAKTVGGMLPMIAKAIGIDPALMAGPLVSSIIDMISLVIYFALATLILGI
ncbi:MAG: magnesium transporter [Firmicutes bacterium]|nr:magnesium transporter [Bacillota bacterium]